MLFGKLRQRQEGRSGGHNGIKSIDAHCGKEYRRMRLGIGHPGIREKVTGHVLGDFAKADKVWLDKLLQAIADNAALLVNGKDSTFMNKVTLDINEKSNEPKPKAKAKSHIHQARSTKLKDAPKSGPMADMLKKLFGDKDDK